MENDCGACKQSWSPKRQQGTRTRSPSSFKYNTATELDPQNRLLMVSNYYDNPSFSMPGLEQVFEQKWGTQQRIHQERERKKRSHYGMIQANEDHIQSRNFRGRGCHIKSLSCSPTTIDSSPNLLETKPRALRHSFSIPTCYDGPFLLNGHQPSTKPEKTKLGGRDICYVNNYVDEKEVVEDDKDCEKDDIPEINLGMSMNNLGKSDKYDNMNMDEDCDDNSESVVVPVTPRSMNNFITEADKNTQNFNIQEPEPENKKQANIHDLACAGWFPDPTANLEKFVIQPAPRGVTIKCRITRDKKGVDRGVHPNYYLHMECEDGAKVFLLTARKRMRSALSTYIICTDPVNKVNSGESCVGRLRSNLLGTEFTLCNEMSGTKNSWWKLGSIRSEMVGVVYEPNVFRTKGPRKMTVLIPEMNNNNERIELKATRDDDGLIARWKGKSMENILELHNKPPIWNEVKRTHVLYFHGRVTQASVKNFQIVSVKGQKFLMQFGRIADEVFTMDYNYPMCAVQAFAVALTSFDRKLACS